jgi:hypothetical protein
LLVEELENGTVNLSSTSFDWVDSLNYPYGRNFEKLYKSINGEKVENYKDVNKL